LEGGREDAESYSLREGLRTEGATGASKDVIGQIYDMVPIYPNGARKGRTAPEE